MSVTIIDSSLTSERNILSISQLNENIKSLIEKQIGQIWVQGEISNFKAHSSGHFYFSLKDKNAQIKAIMFRGHNSRLKFNPKEGMEVVARGQVSVYTIRGEYQIYVDLLEPLGAGALQQAFEQLKIKLKSEGLFNSDNKKKLKPYPSHVTIITSPTGAVIKDILNVLKRRRPNLKLTLVPTMVQGESSISHILQSLENAYKLNTDAIILARGGGSIEDLWCFNDEKVARLIAKSPVPLISAIGHEVDFTIADFVADLRAPTPSAAAEIVSISNQEVSLKISQNFSLLFNLIRKKTLFSKQMIEHLKKQLVDPQKKLRDLILRKDDLEDRLFFLYKINLEKKSTHLRQLKQQLFSHSKLTESKFKFLEFLKYQMHSINNQIFKSQQQRAHLAISLLDNLSPLKTLSRGYSYHLNKNGQVIRSTQGLKKGDELISVLGDGKFKSQITEIIKESSYEL